jgi:antitoxin MazE
MNTTIRNIGNSKGIILPKSLLMQCKIENEVSIEIKDNHIIITAATPPAKRKGWEKAFKEMAENGDDALVMPDVFHDENTDEWTWK